MLRLFGNRKVLCDGITRRDLLHIGGMGAFGVTLADALSLQNRRAAAAETSGAAAASQSSKFGQAKSCILIYKYGSPPQHETFDPKPAAPVEIQGEMKAVSTK